jgi:hypothetical protein
MAQVTKLLYIEYRYGECFSAATIDTILKAS